jgi:hypothetical protein
VVAQSATIHARFMLEAFAYAASYKDSEVHDFLAFEFGPNGGDALLRLRRVFRRQFGSRSARTQPTHGSSKRFQDFDQQPLRLFGIPFQPFRRLRGRRTRDGIGREILATKRDWLVSQGAQIIELDTDGIYFSPPDRITIEGLQSGLSAQLPAGIEVEFDSQYQAMLSYKAKNAAFLLEGGRVVVKGGALRSRGREPVLRRYLRDTLRMLLERRQDDAGKLFDSYTQAISSRTLPIEDLAVGKSTAVS